MYGILDAMGILHMREGLMERAPEGTEDLLFRGLISFNLDERSMETVENQLGEVIN